MFYAYVICEQDFPNRIKESSDSGLTLRQTSCEFTCGHDVGDMVHLQASYVSLMYNVKLTS